MLAASLALLLLLLLLVLPGVEGLARVGVGMIPAAGTGSADGID
jgi:hypothetical protein